MAASKKSQGDDERSRTAKGQNSRTGGAATPRAPKPKRADDPEPTNEPAGRRIRKSGRARRASSSQGDGDESEDRGLGGRSGGTGAGSAPARKPAKRSASASRASSAPSRAQPRARRSNAPDGGSSRKKLSGSGTPGASRDSTRGARTEPSERDDAGSDAEDPGDERAGSDSGHEDRLQPFSLIERVKLFFLQPPPEPPPEGGDERPARAERAPLAKREPPVDVYLPDGTKVPRWGLGDVAMAFVAALFLPVIGLLLFLVLGYVPTAHAPGLGGDGLVLGEAVGHVAAGQPPAVTRSFEHAPYLLQFFSVRVLFWAGLLGPTAYAVWRKGNGFVKDLKLRFEWIDLPLGLAVGVACQLLVIPLIYWVVERISPGQDVGEVARRVIDEAEDPISTAVVVISTTVAAPVVEEIYYRGLTLRAAEKRFGPAWALAGTSAFFAVTHFTPIVWPGILVFGVVLGVLAQRTNRLGASIFAHIGFNLTTLLVLLFRIDIPIA